MEYLPLALFLALAPILWIAMILNEADIKRQDDELNKINGWAE
jgi:hypothetical protein